jgi:hypothetical protein
MPSTASLLWHMRQVSAPFGEYAASAACGIEVAGTKAQQQASAASRGIAGLVMLCAPFRQAVS